MAFICLVVSISCNNDRGKSSATKLVNDWVGKTIIFQDNAYCYTGETSVACPDPTDRSYKILVYTDSVGCTSCKLHLPIWEVFINEIDGSVTEPVSFLFYFQPKSQEELIATLKQNRFDHPIYIDDTGDISKINALPSRMEHQCFLLDRDNKVLAIGNPILNQKIWNLYMEILINQTKQTERR